MESRSYMRTLGTMTCLLVLIALSGCQKKTPVKQVSIEQSSVSFSEKDLSHLKSEWPGWRGPDQSGVSGEADTPTHWSETENVKWRVDVPGRGNASPVIVNNRIYLATADDTAQKQSVVAFDVADGRQLWSTTVSEGGFPSSGQMHPKSTHANGTVLCDGTRVITAFLHHDKITAYALNAETGEVIWSQELGAFNSKFGYAPSPVLYNSFVIIACDNQGGGYLCALDAESGELAWRVERPLASTYSSPRIANVDEKDQLLISGGEKIISYDPRTGKENWQTPGTAEATCGTVVVAKDLIIASGGYPQSQTIALDSAGQKQWEVKTKLYEPSLITVGDALFGITDKGIAYCWDIATGAERWKERLGGNFSASPVAVGDTIYVSNLEGQTFVFKADSSSFQQISVNRLGTDCYASPAVYDGDIYLRIGTGNGQSRQEELVCLSRQPSGNSSQN